MVSLPPPVQMLSLQSNHPRASSLDIQNSKLSASEKFAIAQLRKEMDAYILQEYTQSCNGANIPILNIQDYVTVVSPVTTNKYNVVYLQVQCKSESKDTLMAILFDLHQRFIE